MSVTAVLLAWCVMAPPLMTFEADAVRVDALVAALAKQSGQDLACDPVVAAEPVIVQVRQVELNEVLAHLADVVGGEWISRNGEKRLTRTPGLRAKQEREEERRTAEFIAALLKGMREQVDALPQPDAREADLILERFLNPRSGTADYEEYLRVQRTNPLHRAVVRILASTDPVKLARMRIGERMVFSDRPTPVQHALSAAGNRAVSTLIADVHVLLAARERLADPQRYINLSNVLEFGSGTLDAGYGKTILAISKMGPARFRYDLVVADGRSDLWLRSQSIIPSRTFGATIPASVAGPKLELTETAKAFAYMRMNAGYASAGQLGGSGLPAESSGWVRYAVSKAENEGKPPDLGISALIGDPVGQDPLGVVAGPLLRQVASERKQPLIASLSDEAIVAVSEAVNFNRLQTQADLLDLLQKGSPMDASLPHATLSDSEGWMVVKPFFPFAARARRFDRIALRTLVQAIRKQGAVRIADVGRYLERGAMPDFASLEQGYLVHADRNVDRSAVEMMFGPALPILASSTQGQWQRFEAGIPVRDLSPSQQEHVRRWVYELHRYGAGPMIDTRGPLRTEPTELFPSGVPNEARLSIERTEIPLVMARTKTGYRLFLNLDSLGYEESNKTAGPFEGQTRSREFSGYQPAVQTTWTVRLELPGNIELRSGVPETVPVAGSREGPRDALPEAMRAHIDLVRKAYDGG